MHPGPLCWPRTGDRCILAWWPPSPCIHLYRNALHRAGVGALGQLLTPQLLEATSCSCPVISLARPEKGSCPLPPNDGQRRSRTSGRGSASCEGVPASSRPASSCYCYQIPLPTAAILLLSCSSAFYGSLWSSQLRSRSQLASLIWHPSPSAPWASVT